MSIKTNDAMKYLTENQSNVEFLAEAGNILSLDYGFDLVRAAYSTHVTGVALKTAKLHDLVGFEAVEDAPTSYEEIRLEVHRSRVNRVPFRVWSGASDNTVFESPYHNYAFRFAHDLMHFQFHRGFDLDDEEWLGKHWTTMVDQRAGSAVAILALCDGLGQVYYGKHSGHDFVENQYEFVRGLYMHVSNEVAGARLAWPT